MLFPLPERGKRARRKRLVRRPAGPPARVIELDYGAAWDIINVMNRDAIARRDLWAVAPFVLAATLLPFTGAPAAAQFDDFACGACIHDEITHFWRIPEHSRFGNNFAIAQRCAAIEYPLPEFKVTCDGTQATEFELRHVDVLGCRLREPVQLAEAIHSQRVRREVELPDPNFYGSIEVTELEERHLVFKYTHPTDPPPAGEVSRDIYHRHRVRPPAV